MTMQTITKADGRRISLPNERLRYVEELEGKVVVAFEEGIKFEFKLPFEDVMKIILQAPKQV